MLNDFVVLAKIKEGDVKAFEKLFKQHYNSLCMYAFSITERKDIAEEAVQDVFYNIWKEKENLQIKSSVKNYLFGAVRNHALRYKEKLLTQERYIDFMLVNEENGSYQSPQEILEYKELENVIANILKKMPERRKQIFTMHRFGEKKYTEIASHYSISIKTVEAEMTKAYKALRKGIELYTHNHEF
jgi:RNA polymerase sigma-70 factor, Bacteroides expansion family 1